MITFRWTLVGVAIVLATAFTVAQQGARGGDWTRYGADRGMTKYGSPSPTKSSVLVNKATGAVLWETELPAGTTGAPMTYMFEGKQYLLVAIGSAEPRGSGFVALSLP